MSARTASPAARSTSAARTATTCALALALAALAALPRAHGAVTGTLVLHNVNAATWYGTSAVATTPDPATPVLLATSWVFQPYEVAALLNGTGTLWVSDPLPAERQMFSIYSSASAVVGPTDNNVVAAWTTKSTGVLGNCSINVFNAQLGPARSPLAWSAFLYRDTCGDVNLDTIYSSAAMSDDGATVVAVAFDASMNVTVQAFDGPTGELLWRRYYAPTTPAQQQYWVNNGVSISGDGEWVSFNAGDASAEIPVYVLAARTGAPRSPQPLTSSDELQIVLSFDAQFTVTASGAAASAQLWRWDSASGAYASAGVARAPQGSWYLLEADISFDPAADKWYVGLAYQSTDLDRAAFFIYDAADFRDNAAVASYISPVNNNGYDCSGITITCYASLCAAAKWQGDGEPTLLLLDAHAAPGAGPVWNASTPGSMLSVSLAAGPDPSSVFLGAAGCSTHSVCTDPGADAFLYLLTISA